MVVLRRFGLGPTITERAIEPIAINSQVKEENDVTTRQEA